MMCYLAKCGHKAWSETSDISMLSSRLFPLGKVSQNCEELLKKKHFGDILLDKANFSKLTLIRLRKM